MRRPKFKIYFKKIKSNWRKLALIGGLALLAVTLLVQIFYPAEKLLPFTRIDNQAVGGQQKTEVIKQLDDAYRNEPVYLYAGQDRVEFDAPKTSAVGLKISNQQRVEEISYPWYMRIVPTSLLWYGIISKPEKPAYSSDEASVKSYVHQEFGADCRIAPKNPEAKVTRDKITVVEAENGGECKTDEVIATLKKIQPVLGEKTEARLNVTPIFPAIETSQLEKLVDKVEAKLKTGVEIVVGDEKIKLDSSDVRSWLIFSTEDNTLKLLVDQEKSQEKLGELLGDKVFRSPGVTKITTHDFAEVGRQTGASGQELDVNATGGSIAAYLVDDSEQAEAITKEVPAKLEYTRTYSSTNEGLSALIQNYAKDRPGTYGVSLVELSNERRRAGYNDNKAFTTASTYKVYVAYSVLKRIESGDFSWNDSISGGRNASKCFDDMISQSDNACAEAFVQKIGYTPLHRDVSGLGLKGTSFIDKESFKTTAADLSNFMAMLESSQLPISGGNRTKFINALNQNVYRRGIPAGASGQVADKVGFLDALLHDTAIVYSPSGTYVLTILTDGSSWANIAELTKQIEKIRG